MHYKTCEVCGIKSGRNKGEKRLFLAKFPLDEARCKQWVKLVGKEDLAYVPIEKLHSLKHVCVKHFKPTDLKKKKTQLKKNAVPSIGLTREPLADELLTGFPLHVAMQEASVTSSSQLEMEHNYCKTFKSKKKREHSPVPSTSTAEMLPMAITVTPRSAKRLRFSPVPSTSTVEMLPMAVTETPRTAKRLKLSPVPSTSAAELLPMVITETSRTPKSLRPSPVPSTSSAEILPMVVTETSRTPKSLKLSPEPSTSTAAILPVTTRKISSDPAVTITETSSSIKRSKQSSNHSPSTVEKTLATKPKKVVKKPLSGKIEPTTHRKKKLLNKLKKCKGVIKSLRIKVNQIESISSPVLKSFIESTVKNQKRKAKGRRWSNLNKTVALALYKKSPKAYRYLSHLLSMPSVRTLQTILQNMKMEPGIDPSILTHLKSKAVTMKVEDKICVLLFDEIALKSRLIYNVAEDKIDGYVDLGSEGGRSEKIADHALVFMLQGVHKKMKQPIAHYFVKGTIATEKLVVIIKTVIRALTAVGYKIIATVCDQGPTNVGALNLLKTFSPVPVESNFFLLDKEKVFIVFDVPHLFKSIRNNFLQAGELRMDGKTAKWQHLINLEEKNRTTLHFRKITKLHVAPNYRSKMRVKLAAQILSNTVAGVLKLQAESVKVIKDSNAILQTGQVVEQLDRLFDATNGPSSKDDIKSGLRENVSKNSFHHQFWPECIRMLKTLQFLKSDSQIRLRNVRCVNGYVITISSFQDIWKYVESKKFKYLNLRQLNQDALENLFGIIRQHSPTNRNPTCHHFISALKSSILTRLSTPKGKGSNCEQDDNKILFDFQDVVFSSLGVKANPTSVATEARATIVNDVDHPVLHIPETETFVEELEQTFKSFEKQPTVYVAGYLASVILKNIVCEQCINCLKVLNPKPNSYYNYIALREWWPDKISLTYPTLQLCHTIDVATTAFDQEVKPVLYIKDISKFSKTVILSSVDISWVCQNHSDIIVDLLLRRLSHLLIRNQCGIYNRTFALSEESSADSEKKAQQQSKGK